MKQLIHKILYKLNYKLFKCFPRAFQRENLMNSDYSERNWNLVGAEIGTYLGKNALYLLKKSDIKKLYLIDPYEEYTGGDYLPEFSEAEFVARNRLTKYGHKIIWVKKNSDDAVNDIPNNLDFVYIDGNHEYEFVKKDIENYYPKLKVGGLLAGHDFDIHYGIIPAVLEFVNENKLKLYVKDLDWWVIKK